MTATNENTRTLQTSDGIVLAYAFDFEIQGTVDSEFQDQVLVYENGVLTVNSYTIHTVSPDGGIVDFTVGGIPPAVGELAIVRNKRNTQNTILPTLNPYPSVEKQLDDLTLQVQDVEQIANFGIRQPEWEQKRAMELPSIAERAIRYVGMDQDGNVEMSELVAVSVQHLDCTVSINAEPYNADSTGVIQSRVGIQAALDSGAKLVIACPGIYLADYFNVPSNVTFYAPGATFIHSAAANEGDTISLGVNNKNLTVENSHLVAYMLSGYESVNVENYRDCSIGNTIIDQCELGLVFGAWAASGIADNFAAEDVIIQSCVAGGITGSAGVNNKSNINFRNVSVLECGNETRTVINTSSLSGSWIGGDVKRNTGNGTMGLDCDDAFKLSGVTFDENGNATPSYPELTIFDANGLTIDSCTFEATDITKGRTTGINFAASAMNGFVLTGNKIVGTTHDSSGFWGILCTGGPTNGFIAGNNVNVTGIQTDYLVDTVNNYLIVDGAKV